MSERIEDMDITPTLVFDEVPDGQGTPEELPAGAQNGMERKPDSEFDESRLSPEERKMVDDFSAKIDLHNSQAILQYGVGTQKKMADFSESALKNVRTKDLGEVGEMLSFSSMHQISSSSVGVSHPSRMLQDSSKLSWGFQPALGPTSGSLQ